VERNEIPTNDLLDIRRAYFETLDEISFQFEREVIQNMEIPSRRIGPLRTVRLQWREFGFEPIGIPKAFAKTSRLSASSALSISSEYNTDTWDKETTTYQFSSCQIYL
jgi:hypothetical protein